MHPEARLIISDSFHSFLLSSLHSWPWYPREMSEFPEEKTGNGYGSERDHNSKKQKVGVAEEEGLSSLNEEERALILQMRQAKKEDQSGEEEEGVDSSDDEGDKQKNQWLKPPSQRKNTRVGEDYQATIPSFGGV